MDFGFLGFLRLRTPSFLLLRYFVWVLPFCLLLVAGGTTGGCACARALGTGVGVRVRVSFFSFSVDVFC